MGIIYITRAFLQFSGRFKSEWGRLDPCGCIINYRVLIITVDIFLFISVGVFTSLWAFFLLFRGHFGFVVGVCTSMWVLINTVGVFLISVGVSTSL